MSHIDYLSRLPLDQHLLHEPEEPNKKIFVGQINITRKAKYVMIFIYNAYGS